MKAIVFGVALAICGVVGCTPRGTPTDEYQRRVKQVTSDYERAVVAKAKELGLVLEDAPAGGRTDFVSQEGGHHGPGIPLPEEIVSIESDRLPVKSDRKLAPRPRQEVEIGQTWEDHPSAPTPRFARDSEGKLWMLLIAVKSTGVVYVTRDGCQSMWDSGVPPMRLRVIYSLPGDVELAGVKEVSVSALMLQESYAEGMCRSDGPPKP